MAWLPPPFVRKIDPPVEAEPIPYPAAVRWWSDDYLHSRLPRSGAQPIHREVLASELRMREAWRSPVSSALTISMLSFVASIAALIVSALAA